MNKLSAFTFSAIAVIGSLFLPALAFASDGTFTASSVSYDHNTKTLSFHGSSFSEDVGHTIHVAEITTCTTVGCVDTSNTAWCDDNSTVLTDPIDYTCALNSSIYGYNYNPNPGDTVHLVIQS